MQIGAVDKGHTVRVDLQEQYTDAGFVVLDDGRVIHIYLNDKHIYVVNHREHNIARQELAYTMGLLYGIWADGYQDGIEAGIPKTTAEAK